MRQRNTHASNGQSTDHHCPKGIRDFLTQSAVVAHVLFVMHRMDHRSRTKKQHCFEEGMGKKMEHRHRINTYAGGHKHIAKLGTGRISNHPLYIVLDNPNQP